VALTAGGYQLISQGNMRTKQKKETGRATYIIQSFFEASDLPEDGYALSKALTHHFAKGQPRSVSVVSAGPGARHTLIGCLNFTWFDTKRKMVRYKQAGRGGLGTVFENKGLRALVVRWDGVSLTSNQPADKESLKRVARLHAREIVELDPKQNEMARIGTTHLVPIMNDFDLLPVNNFKFGKDDRASLIGRDVFARIFDPGYDGCWMGCTVACAHGVRNFVPVTGPYRGQQVFAQQFNADARVMADIGMEAKGLEFSEYICKESLAQQGGYGLAAGNRFSRGDRGAQGQRGDGMKFITIEDQ
jgi:aldehyde:ferredoxin oxidoreductase